jgi:hypothetical protein
MVFIVGLPPLVFQYTMSRVQSRIKVKILAFVRCGIQRRKSLCLLFFIYSICA